MHKVHHLIIVQTKSKVWLVCYTQKSYTLYTSAVEHASGGFMRTIGVSKGIGGGIS